MKAKILRDGFIWIVAENTAEAFAMKYILKDKKEQCDSCHQVKHIPVLFDYTILECEEKEDGGKTNS